MKLNLTSLTYATILTICLIVILTIWGEVSFSFKSFLTGTGGHHWTAKGLFSAIFFLTSYFLLSKTAKTGRGSLSLTRQIIYTIIATVLGGIIIFGFYVFSFVS